MRKVEESRKADKLQAVKEEAKRQYQDNEGNIVSRKKMKKLRRINRRPENPNGVNQTVNKSFIKCGECVNPLVINYNSIIIYYVVLINKINCFRVPNAFINCVRNVAKINVLMRI